jgi:hypothetical protein
MENKDLCEVTSPIQLFIVLPSKVAMLEPLEKILSPSHSCKRDVKKALGMASDQTLSHAVDQVEDDTTSSSSKLEDGCTCTPSG